MTANQPLSENSIARVGVGGGPIVIRYSNTCLKSFRTISLNSEGILRGTDNFSLIFNWGNHITFLLVTGGTK